MCDNPKSLPAFNPLQLRGLLSQTWSLGTEHPSLMWVHAILTQMHRNHSPFLYSKSGVCYLCLMSFSSCSGRNRMIDCYPLSPCHSLFYSLRHLFFNLKDSSLFNLVSNRNCSDNFDEPVAIFWTLPVLLSPLKCWDQSRIQCSRIAGRKWFSVFSVLFLIISNARLFFSLCSWALTRNFHIAIYYNLKILPQRARVGVNSIFFVPLHIWVTLNFNCFCAIKIMGSLPLTVWLSYVFLLSEISFIYSCWNSSNLENIFLHHLFQLVLPLMLLLQSFLKRLYTELRVWKSRLTTSIP